MGTELSNSRFELLLLAYLSVHVPDDNFDVMIWTAVVFLFQLFVEGIFLIISASKMRGVYVDYADVEKSTFDLQHAHSIANSTPVKHTFRLYVPVL